MEKIVAIMLILEEQISPFENEKICSGLDAGYCKWKGMKKGDVMKW